MSLVSAFAKWARDLNKSTSRNDEGVWWDFLGSGSGSVQRETDQNIVDFGFIANGSVYSIVNKVSQLTSRLPYQITKDGELLDDDLSRVLRTLSKEQGRIEYLYQYALNLVLTGDAFAVIEEGALGFEDYDLTNLPSQMVTPVRAGRQEDTTSPVVAYDYFDGHKRVRYDAENIIHSKFYDPSAEGVRSGKGLSPFQAGFLSIQAGNNANIANARIFENGGPQHLIFSKKGGLSLTPKDKRAIDAATRDRFGGAHNAGAIRTVTGDTQTVKVGSTPKELGTDEAKTIILRELCNVLGVPSSELNDPANKTYSNAKEARRAMYSDVAIPLFTTIMQKHINALAPKFGSDALTVAAKVCKDEIEALNETPLERSKFNLEMFKNGAVSLEEFQIREGIEDTGSTYVKATTNAPSNGTQQT